jgi:hypothetical protein
MPSNPPVSTPIVDESGRVTDAWSGFFSELAGRAKAIDMVTVGPTPFAYDPPAAGHVLIQGGTSISTRIVRGRNSIVVPAASFIPVSLGDSLVVSFAAPPTLTFFPG